MIKNKKDFKYEFWGVIDKIENNNISARIYNLNDHEFVDEITFDISEFLKEEQEFVNENIVFLWTVEKKQNKHSSIFKIKRVDPLIKNEGNYVK
jgi:hypothetical protein